MILDLFIYIIQFYINQNTFLPGFIIRKRVYFKQLKELKMCIPSEMEKNKINEFINLLNERIQTQN